MVRWHPIKCNLKIENRNGFWFVSPTSSEDIFAIASRFKVTITNSDKTKKWSGIGVLWVPYENHRNRPDANRIRLISKSYEVDEVSVEEVNTYFFSSSEYEKYLRTRDTISVGDFVRCSGSRDSKSWRKITEITDFDIVGQKYRYEDKKGFVSEPYMSTNMIKTITHILKKDLANDYCT